MIKCAQWKWQMFSFLYNGKKATVRKSAFLLSLLHHDHWCHSGLTRRGPRFTWGPSYREIGRGNRGPGAKLMGAPRNLMISTCWYCTTTAAKISRRLCHHCVLHHLNLWHMLLKPRFSVEQSFDDHTMSSSSVNRGANSATDRESLLGAQHEEDLQLQSTGKHWMHLTAHSITGFSFM